MRELDPPDLTRCQAELKPSYSFMTFGRPSWVRCDEQPNFLATEATAGKDGRFGQMSLCWNCACVAVETLGRSALVLEEINAQG